jgi:hypothetical protein
MTDMGTKLEERILPYLKDHHPSYDIHDIAEMKAFYNDLKDEMLGSVSGRASAYFVKKVDWGELEGLYCKCIDEMKAACEDGCLAELEVIRRARGMDKPTHYDLAQIVLDVYGSADGYYSYGRKLSELADSFAVIIESYPLTGFNRLLRWRYGSSISGEVRDAGQLVMDAAEEIELPYEGEIDI